MMPRRSVTVAQESGPKTGQSRPKTAGPHSGKTPRRLIYAKNATMRPRTGTQRQDRTSVGHDPPESPVTIPETAVTSPPHARLGARSAASVCSPQRAAAPKTVRRPLRTLD